jgi:hypothetical protein
MSGGAARFAIARSTPREAYPVDRSGLRCGWLTRVAQNLVAMSRPQQQRLVHLIRDVFAEFFENVRVSEVGSLDVSGSVRPLFRDCESGRRPAPWVHVVRKARTIPEAL